LRVLADVVVLLPAYNEEPAIGPLLERIGEALRGRSYQIVVVDDGSTDRTVEEARRFLERLPLTIVPRPRNGGLGAALATGIEHVRRQGHGGVLFTMDADNTQDPALMPRMLDELEAGADVVVASRFVPGAGAVGVPFYRRVLSGGASVLFGVAIGARGVRDYTCGYRCYRMALIERIAGRFRPLIRARGFAVMTELLAKAAAENARCVEVPLVLRYDMKPGRSKLRLLPTLVEYARVLLLARVEALSTASPAFAGRRPG
jgi:dolichol-phosphate mannosyltransferase